MSFTTAWGSEDLSTLSTFILPISHIIIVLPLIYMYILNPIMLLLLLFWTADIHLHLWTCLPFFSLHSCLLSCALARWFSLYWQCPFYYFFWMPVTEKATVFICLKIHSTLLVKDTLSGYRIQGGQVISNSVLRGPSPRAPWEASPYNCYPEGDTCDILLPLQMLFRSSLCFPAILLWCAQAYCFFVFGFAVVLNLSCLGLVGRDFWICGFISLNYFGTF